MIHQLEIRSKAEIGSLKFLQDVSKQTFELAVPSLAADLTLAAKEALANALEATIYSGDCLHKEITLKLNIDETYAEIVVIDDAADLPLDWKDPLREKIEREDIWKVDKKDGLPLIHHLVDEIWQYTDDQGRHVFGMRKARPAVE